MSLIVRCRLRKFIISRCKHWGIKRQRIPAEVIDTLAEDLAKQVDIRIASMLNKPDPLPKPPRPRKPKAPGKRCLNSHPTLF